MLRIFIAFFETSHFPTMFTIVRFWCDLNPAYNLAPFNTKLLCVYIYIYIYLYTHTVMNTTILQLVAI